MKSKLAKVLRVQCNGTQLVQNALRSIRWVGGSWVGGDSF